jgi:mRNA-degrading endonuclease RelE of RelBE toxin-antitoxin system
VAFEVIFSERAASEFKKLDKSVQQRIINKLKKYAKDENLSEAKRLVNPILGTFRYELAITVLYLIYTGKKCKS